MKDSTPSINVPLPAARAWTSLAIAALAPVFLATPSAAAQVVTAEVVAVPSAATGVTALTSVFSDKAGSWVADARRGFPSESVIFGVLAGSGTSAPGVLRVPQTLQGYPQQSIFFSRVRGLEVAYTAAEPASGGFSSWINDEVVAQPGDVIGSTGLEWLGSGTPRMTSIQRFYVFGSAFPTGNPAATRQVVVRYPEENVVLAVGDTPLGLSDPVTRINTFETNELGNSWVAVVTYNSTATGQEEMAVIDTCSVYRYSSFALAAQTEGSFTSWTEFTGAFVDSARRVTILGRDALGSVILRNADETVRASMTELYDIDEDGLVLTSGPFNQGIRALYNGTDLNRVGADGVDATGNGFPDAGWAVTGQSNTFIPQAAFLGDGRILLAVDLQVPGSGVLDSIVLASLALPNDVVCDGVPNSTGEASSLRAVGVDQAAFNDLELHLVNMPPGSVVLPLVSKTSGFTANPAGSTGNLCLGGAIGRGILFTTGGTSTFRVFPQLLPQPNGFTAAQPGETWFFQVWHRDQVAGNATSNFSDALAVTFR